MYNWSKKRISKDPHKGKISEVRLRDLMQLGQLTFYVLLIIEDNLKDQEKERYFSKYLSP